MQIDMPAVFSKLRQRISGWIPQRIRWLVIGVKAGVIFVLLHWTGCTQWVEWKVYDRWIQQTARAAPDSCVTIIGIDEMHDIRRMASYPVSDQALTNLLRKVESYHPRCIGMDIYRDKHQPPGDEAFRSALQNDPTPIIAAERLPLAGLQPIWPPDVFRTPDNADDVGFTNLMPDSDDICRRCILQARVPLKYEYHDDPSAAGPTDFREANSLPLQLARFYLHQEQPPIDLGADAAVGELRLGKALLPRFKLDDGAYVRADDRGYQMMLDFRGPAHFITCSMQEVIDGKVNPKDFSDRMVLIGLIAEDNLTRHIHRCGNSILVSRFMRSWPTSWCAWRTAAYARRQDFPGRWNPHGPLFGPSLARDSDAMCGAATRL